MKSFRKNIGTILFLCICSNTYAQYDNYDSVEDWTLEDVEEEAPKPQHKEYKNALYVHYSPSRYFTDDYKQKFHEFSVGYARSIQIMEDMPQGKTVKYTQNGLLISKFAFNLLKFLYI